MADRITPIEFLTDCSGTVQTGGVAQAVTQGNPFRRYFFIQNLSSNDLWINFDIDAVAGQPSIKIASGGGFVIEGSYVPKGLISIYGGTTSQAYTAKEA